MRVTQASREKIPRWDKWKVIGLCYNSHGGSRGDFIFNRGQSTLKQLISQQVVFFLIVVVSYLLSAQNETNFSTISYKVVTAIH